MMVTQTEANLIRQIRSSQNNIEETIRGVESIFQVRDKDEEDVLPDNKNEQEQLQLWMMSSRFEAFGGSDIDNIGLDL